MKLNVATYFYTANEDTQMALKGRRKNLSVLNGNHPCVIKMTKHTFGVILSKLCLFNLFHLAENNLPCHIFTNANILMPLTESEKTTKSQGLKY